MDQPVPGPNSATDRESCGECARTSGDCAPPSQNLSAFQVRLKGEHFLLMTKPAQQPKNRRLPRKQTHRQRRALEQRGGKVHENEELRSTRPADTPGRAMPMEGTFDPVENLCRPPPVITQEPVVPRTEEQEAGQKIDGDQTKPHPYSMRCKHLQVRFPSSCGNNGSRSRRIPPKRPPYSGLFSSAPLWARC